MPAEAPPLAALEPLQSITAARSTKRTLRVEQTVSLEPNGIPKDSELLGNDM